MTPEAFRALGIPPANIHAAWAVYQRDVENNAVALAGRIIRDALCNAEKGMNVELASKLGAIESKSLTPALCANKAGCDRRTIMRAIVSGELIASQGKTKLWQVNRASFAAWHKARTPLPPILPTLPG